MIIAILLLLGILTYVAQMCLNKVITPYCYDEASLREEELKEGFTRAVDAYENDWQREAFELDCRGTKISGEIIRNPQAEGNRVVIICHGHTANRYATLKYADIFYRYGYHCVIFDERHFGRSEGAISTLGQEEAKDLAQIIGFVRERFPGCKLVLHGESMGAATSLLVLQYEKPDLVIADCPFADSTRLFAEWIHRNMHVPPAPILFVMTFLAVLRYDYHFKKVSPIRIVSNSDVPICFMHGDHDNLIDCSHSEEMFKVCRNPDSELHLFPGADHAQSIASDPQSYEQIMLAFLKKCKA